MLHIKVIACDVFHREINALASQSLQYVDVTYLHQGLHNTPDILRAQLQEAVDKANEGFPYNHNTDVPHYDYIVLGYGLCSNGTAGIHSAHVPLLLPRAHDCITLLLGSKERYGDYFKANPGTYWYATGWLERAWQPGEKRFKSLLAMYTEQYGEDNAEWLLEQEQKWLKEYKRAAFIRWNSLPLQDEMAEETRKAAQFLGWEYEEMQGDDSLLKRLLNGDIRLDEVLVVPPGATIQPSFDAGIVKVEDTTDGI